MLRSKKKKTPGGEKLYGTLSDWVTLWGKWKKLLGEKSSIALWVTKKRFSISEKNS